MADNSSVERDYLRANKPLLDELVGASVNLGLHRSPILEWSQLPDSPRYMAQSGEVVPSGSAAYAIAESEALAILAEVRARAIARCSEELIRLVCEEGNEIATLTPSARQDRVGHLEAQTNALATGVLEESVTQHSFIQTGSEVVELNVSRVLSKNPSFDITSVEISEHDSQLTRVLVIDQHDEETSVRRTIEPSNYGFMNDFIQIMGEDPTHFDTLNRAMILLARGDTEAANDTLWQLQAKLPEVTQELFNLEISDPLKKYVSDMKRSTRLKLARHELYLPSRAELEEYKILIHSMTQGNS